MEDYSNISRLKEWLSAPPVVGENMIWIGKDYSLAQLKQDVSKLSKDFNINL
jgi:hypothetical protein